MSLADAIREATNTAFAGLDSTLVAVTYQKRTSTYSTATRTPTYTVEETRNIRGHRQSFASSESGTGPLFDSATIQPLDNMFVFNAADFNFTPGMDDNIIDSGGDWQIKAINQRPASTVISFHVRRP